MIVQADARHIPLADESVHCCVTSPPYWGLRDYGIKPSIWDGDPECEHEWQVEAVYREMRLGLNLAASPASTRGGAKKIAEVPDQEFERSWCGLCGAWRGVLGLEPTPQLYVQHIVQVFREVWRVLRPDGTLWLNLGDCYATGAGSVGDCPGDQGDRWRGYRGQHGADKKRDRRALGAAGKTLEWEGGIGPMTQPNRMPLPGLKPKDIVGVPWSVAFALRDDGWWLRSDIIWAKPNPMPESVGDRPTKAHEYIFLLAKSERYYYDALAVAEPASDDTHARYARGRSDHHKWADGGPGNQTIARTFEHMRAPGVHPKAAPAGSGIRANESFSAALKDIVSTRNKRTVWEIATQPYSGAHFATFPEQLVKTCIAAGTSEHGCCAECGAPWERVLEAKFYGNWNPGPGSNGPLKVNAQVADRKGSKFQEQYEPPKTIGWRPTCRCGTESRTPAVVLDPFSGSGTTGEVAFKMGRRFVCLDVSEPYLELMRQRIPPMAFLMRASV